MREENQTIIKALNMFGRVPETWELLNEIERLNNIMHEIKEYIMSNLITEWDIKNGGCVSGSDLPAYAITPILDIIDGGDEQMKDEIKEILDKLKDNDWYEELDLTGTKWIELKQEETNQLLNCIINLKEENEDYKLRCENAQDLILNELSHLKANDEETWNKEFYDENNKLDYRKLCIELLNQVINLLDGGDEQ